MTFTKLVAFTRRSREGTLVDVSTMRNKESAQPVSGNGPQTSVAGTNTEN